MAEFSEEKLTKLVVDYKNSFNDHWPKGRYKWVAVKHFQDHLDINAPNFIEMFQEATRKTTKLFNNTIFSPYNIINKYSKDDPKAIREVFENLYNEDLDLGIRIDEFNTLVNKIRKKYRSARY